MSITPIPLSSLKKGQQITKAQVNSYEYELYECVQLLSVKGDPNESLTGDVDILLSSFYEGSGRSLLVLVCSNGHLLFFLRDGQDKKPTVKQLNWFQNPSKRITALCIDPVRGAWVICACSDASVYLVPALAQVKDSFKDISLSLPASTTDVSRIQYAKLLKNDAKPTCVIWWHTIDDQNIAIVGTKGGELVFLDLATRIEVCRATLKERIIHFELLQDIHERTTHLFIQTAKNWTLQLLLEQPARGSSSLTSSLTQAYDMGYDMLTECTMDSILTDQKEAKEDTHIENLVEILPQDFTYNIQFVKDNIWISKHDTRFSAIEIFSDIKRVPEFIYHVPSGTSKVLLCTNLMFAIATKDDQISISFLSRQLSSTLFGRRAVKKNVATRRADLQTLDLDGHHRLINAYKSKFVSPIGWKQFFPNSAGYDDECELNSFLLVTNDGVFECRPKTSPEHYFTELAMKTNFEVAERLGITLDLNIPLLCEYIGDKIIQTKDTQSAMKFYHLSKCSVSKRASSIIEYGSVTDALIFIKQVLKKQPTILTSKEKKSLADLAIACYIEQVLETQLGGAFSKNLADSFRSFLCDNFDYDEMKAMELLAHYGMTNNLFEVAKARGKVTEALNLLADRGSFQLSSNIQNMLLDCGYAEKVCKASNGLFVKFMQPEETVRFMLAQPDVSKPFIKNLKKLLTKLDEASLLLIARVFDPSRQFIKPFLEKSDLFKRARSGSKVSMSSNHSLSSQVDPYSATAPDIIVMFLMTLINLNAKRRWTKIPDMRIMAKYLSGQFSWSGSMRGRSDSLNSNELVFSEVAQKRLDCGRHHIAFVTAERDLYTWGKASFGRLGHGDLMDEHATSQPMRVESLHMHGIQVLAVSCGALHTVALCQEGVFAWGSNKYGQLGVGDKRKRSRPVLLSDISSKYINSVICGHFHTLAITVDYKLFAWGWGIHGQLGLESVENQVNPQPVNFFKDHRIVQAAAGYAHSAVLTGRGLVYTFGAGLYGQLGIGTNKKETIPQLVETLIDDSIYVIACGCFETLAVSQEQTIYCWGRNHHQYHICGKASNARYGRQMASNTTDISHRYFPEDLPFKLQQPIAQLVCGNWHYMALTSTGIMYTWGCNDCGQLGHYNKTDQAAPRLVKALSRRCVSTIAAGGEFSLVVDADEQVLAWGCADGGLIGIENEGSASTNPVARRSAYSVLAPALVPGLPMHFDQVSIGSGKSISREYIFDQHYDLPDLSSVGQDQPPYSVEAVLLSLFKLNGLYSHDVITQYAERTRQWFVLSYCYELKEDWDLAFKFRIKAIKEYFSQNKDTSQCHFVEKVLQVVQDLFKKFEDYLTENIQENSSLVAMVKCLIEIFNEWQENRLPVPRLEESLRKHIESLCPLYTIVTFGFLGIADVCKSNVLRFALYYVRQQHVICKHLSKVFYDDLLVQIIAQIDAKTNWYDFLSSDCVDLMDKIEDEVQMSGDSALSKDDMIKEIIEHKRKLLNIKPFITLSNAVATTLADASIAQKVNPYNPKDEFKKTVLDEPDSVIFSCSHYLPRYYMLETVVPEFISRMGELPEPLTRTGEVFAQFYQQVGKRIPMVCPYCVYNNLRVEQLQIFREAGVETASHKSSVWEI